MVFRVMPKQEYRLADGSHGTEYQAVLECIKRKEAQKLHLEETIELLRIRLATAEGNPG